jgi:hypothetical protein
MRVTIILMELSLKSRQYILIFVYSLSVNNVSKALFEFLPTLHSRDKGFTMCSYTL